MERCDDGWFVGKPAWVHESRRGPGLGQDLLTASECVSVPTVYPSLVPPADWDGLQPKEK